MTQAEVEDYWGICGKGCDSCVVQNSGVKCLQCYLPSFYEDSRVESSSFCKLRDDNVDGHTALQYAAPSGDTKPQVVQWPSEFATSVANCATADSGGCRRCLQGLRCQQNVENSCACESCKHCGDGFYGDGLTCTPCKDATDSGILTLSTSPTITGNFLNPVMAIRELDNALISCPPFDVNPGSCCSQSN